MLLNWIQALSLTQCGLCTILLPMQFHSGPSGLVVRALKRSSEGWVLNPSWSQNLSIDSMSVCENTDNHNTLLLNLTSSAGINIFLCRQLLPYLRLVVDSYQQLSNYMVSSHSVCAVEGSRDPNRLIAVGNILDTSFRHTAQNNWICGHAITKRAMVEELCQSCYQFTPP